MWAYNSFSERELSLSIGRRKGSVRYESMGRLFFEHFTPSSGVGLHVSLSHSQN